MAGRRRNGSGASRRVGWVETMTWRVDPPLLRFSGMFVLKNSYLYVESGADSVFSRKKPTKLNDVLEAVKSLADVTIVEVSPWGFGVVSNVILPCWKVGRCRNDSELRSGLTGQPGNFCLETWKCDSTLEKLKWAWNLYKTTNATQAPCYWKQQGHEISASYPGKKAMSGPDSRLLICLELASNCTTFGRER